MGLIGLMGPIGPIRPMRPIGPIRPIIKKKTMTQSKYYILLLTALLLSACSTDEPAEPTTQPLQETTYRLNMTICLQPDADLTAYTTGYPTTQDNASRTTGETTQDNTTRAMGDPGTYEHFGRPRYFYVYVVGFTADDKAYPESSGGTVCPIEIEDGSTDELVNRIDVGEGESQWSKYLMTVDPPQTWMDSIYGSKQSVLLKLPSADINKLRVYVAASPTILKHNGHELGVKVGDDDQVLGSSHNESHVLDLKFDVDDDLKDKLQDLYASPWNYAPAGAPYNGLYYYTISDLSKNIDQTRIIYHVASKVDVMWNVDKAQQATNRITYIEARKLKEKNCYLFKPMENTWTTSGDNNDEANNYSKALMDDDISRQWYGRQYFYTIPFRRDNSADGGTAKDFDVNLHILKNGDDKGDNAASGYNLTFRRPLNGGNYEVFTPWVRMDMRFTHDIVYQSITKNGTE